MKLHRRLVALIALDSLRRREELRLIRRRRLRRGGGSASIALTYLIFDSFTRSDSPIGSAEIGGAWADSSGNWIVGSHSAKVSGGTGIQTCTIITAETSGVFQVRLPAVGNFGLLMRRVDDQTFIGTRVTMGLLRLVRMTAGAASTIGSGGTCVAGDVVRVAAAGNSFTVYLNGVEQFTAVDSQGNSETRHGIWTQVASANLDDVSHAQP